MIPLKCNRNLTLLTPLIWWIPSMKWSIPISDMNKNEYSMPIIWLVAPFSTIQVLSNSKMMLFPLETMDTQEVYLSNFSLKSFISTKGATCFSLSFVPFYWDIVLHSFHIHCMQRKKLWWCQSWNSFYFFPCNFIEDKHYPHQLPLLPSLYSFRSPP